jgi:hypothetical protein
MSCRTAVRAILSRDGSRPRPHRDRRGDVRRRHGSGSERSERVLPPTPHRVIGQNRAGVQVPAANGDSCAQPRHARRGPTFKSVARAELTIVVAPPTEHGAGRIERAGVAVAIRDGDDVRQPGCRGYLLQRRAAVIDLSVQQNGDAFTGITPPATAPGRPICVSNPPEGTAEVGRQPAKAYLDVCSDSWRTTSKEPG